MLDIEVAVQAPPYDVKGWLFLFTRGLNLDFKAVLIKEKMKMYFFPRHVR